jgi:hypothetical protein
MKPDWMFFICHSLHLSVVAGFSLDLFRDILSFDKSHPEGVLCVDAVKVFLFGYPTALTTHGLRLTGIGISSVMLVPVLNLLAVLALHDSFLFIFFFVTFPIVWIGAMIAAYFSEVNFRAAVERSRDVLSSAIRRRHGFLLAFLPIVVPFCGNALIITVLEGTMRVNRAFLTPGEDQWQFSQTLALGMTLAQFLDAGRILQKARNNESEYGDFRKLLVGCPTQYLVMTDALLAIAPWRSIFPLTSLLSRPVWFSRA